MIPDFMADSVASYRNDLNWPDWETRYHGNGEVRKIPVVDALGPPDGAEKKFRPTHDIGRITAHRATYGKSRGSYKKKPNPCDHSQHKAWAHDGVRVRCAGCKSVYVQGSAA